jgi:hypothetical protein
MKKINYFNILIIFLSTISLNTFAQTEVTNAPIDKMVDKQEVVAKDKKTPAKDIKKNAKKVEDLEDDLSDFEEIKPDSDISRFNNIAIVQALNKTTAKTSIIDLKVGEKISYGSLKIIAHKCWQSPLEQKPENKILLEIFEVKNENSEKLQEKRIFYGWTFSSSPSISGLEHPIYDIIALNCKNR